MPTSSSSLWHHPPTVADLVQAVAALPPLRLWACLTVLPSMTVATLLLDAAPTTPALSNTLLVVGLGIVVAVVGWLMSRTVTAFDNSVRESKEALLVLTKVVADIVKEQTASTRLTEYMEKRIIVLEHKKEVLEKSFSEMDKVIAVALHEKKKHE